MDREKVNIMSKSSPSGHQDMEKAFLLASAEHHSTSNNVWKSYLPLLTVQPTFWEHLPEIKQLDRCLCWKNTDVLRLHSNLLNFAHIWTYWIFEIKVSWSNSHSSLSGILFKTFKAGNLNIAFTVCYWRLREWKKKYNDNHCFGFLLGTQTSKTCSRWDAALGVVKGTLHSHHVPEEDW